MSKTSPPPIEPVPSNEPFVADSVSNSQPVNVFSTADSLEDRYRNTPIDRSFWPEFWKYAVSISILLFGVGLAYGLSLLKDDPKGQNSKELDQMVGTVEASQYSGELEMTVSGTVVPFREIKVAAEISGNVTKKYESFEAGNFVKKGDKLLEIDPTDYQLQLETRMAEVEQSEKMLDEAREEILGAKRNIKLSRNDYELAQSEFRRNERIKNALSSSEIDQSKRALLNAESALMNRTNTLDMLGAKMK